MTDVLKILRSLKDNLLVENGVINNQHINTTENLVKNCRPLPQPERYDVLDEIRDLAKYLGNSNVGENKTEWLPYYQLYDALCSITYKITKSAEDELKNDNIMRVGADYKSQGFWLADEENAEELATHLKLLYDVLPHKGKSFADGKMKRSVTQGYSVYDGVVNDNQLHVEELPLKAIMHLDDYISKSDLIKDLSNSLGYKLKVCNVRVYRYFHSKVGDQILPHHDGLPPSVFKIMAFNGDIQLKHGAFEVLKERTKLRRIMKIFNPNANEVLESCVGFNPFMIVNSNKKLHRARNPKLGLTRDSIELTLMPRLLDDALVTVGGCQSGAPLNPFLFI